MAIFKYKKPNGSGGYSIEEMPVISNTYIEYVVTEDISQDPQIVLKPSQTSFNINEQKTFNKVTASIDLLSTTPTYTYNINDRNKTITFNSTEWKTTMGYGDKFPPGIKISIPNSIWLNKNTDSLGNLNVELTPTLTSSSVTTGYYTGGTVSVKTFSEDPSYTPSTSVQNITYTATTGFPKGITISAIPTTTLTLENNNTTYNIGSGSWSAGTYPTSITVQVPSDLPAASSPPPVTTITTQNGSIKIDAGYYTSDITITATFPSVSPSGDQSLTPNNNNSSYPIPVGYHASSRTVSPSTQALTITSPSLTTTSGSYYQKTYSYGTGAGSTTNWGNNYLTSLTIRVPTSAAANIVSGTSVCGISGTHVCPTTSLANIASSEEATGSMILDGYKAYNDQGSLITGSLRSDSVGVIEIIRPTYFTLSNSMYQYRIFGDTPEYIQDFTIAINTNQQEIISNGTYSLFGSNASWSSLPSSLYVNVPGIVAQGSCNGDGGAYKLMSDGTLFFYSTGTDPATILGLPATLLSYASTVKKVIFSNIEIIDCSGANSFSSFSNITHITFNEGLMKMNQTSFKSLTLLTLHFPSTLSYLGSSCFWLCNITNCYFCGWSNYYTPFGSSTGLNNSTISYLSLPWSSTWSNADIHPPFGATVSYTDYDGDARID